MLFLLYSHKNANIWIGVINLDLEKLKAFIEQSGRSITFIADKLDMSRESLYKKLDGRIKFSAEETCTLATILRMTSDEIMDIFFAKYVRKNAI